MKRDTEWQDDREERRKACFSGPIAGYTFPLTQLTAFQYQPALLLLIELWPVCICYWSINRQEVLHWHLVDTHTHTHILWCGFYFHGMFSGSSQFFTESASIWLHSASTCTRTYPITYLNSPPGEQTNSSIHTNEPALSERAGMAPGWMEHKVFVWTTAS